MTPLGIPSNLPGENLTGKFYILENFDPGPVGSSAAIAGLYRILAITLAIR